MGFESGEDSKFRSFIQKQKEEERSILQGEEDQMNEWDMKTSDNLNQIITTEALTAKTTERDNRNNEHKNEEYAQKGTVSNNEEPVDPLSLRGAEVLGNESSPTGDILTGALPEPDNEPYKEQLQQEPDQNEDRITGIESVQEDEESLQFKGVEQDSYQEYDVLTGVSADPEYPISEQRGLQQEPDQNEDRITGVESAQEDEEPLRLDLLLDNEDSGIEPSDITKKQDVEQEDRSFPAQGINELASSITKDLEQQNQKYLMELDSLFSNDSPESDIDSLVARSFI